MGDIGWFQVVALLLPLLFMAGLVALGLRLSSASAAAIRKEVAVFDAVLRALETPELRVNPGPVHEHRVQGVLPSHSTLVGELDGYAVSLEMQNPWSIGETAAECIIQVRVTAPLGRSFEETSGSLAAFGFDPKRFETEVEGRSLILAERPKRPAGEELRANPTILVNHLRRVVEYARSVTVGTRAAAASHSAPYGVWNTLAGKRVFLLDGDLRFADELRVALIERGAQPRVFEHSRQLIEAAHLSLPDLIVVALEVPGESGWGVCNRLKKHEQIRFVPVVVLSASSGEKEFEAHRQLRTRAQDYIAKPVPVEHLLARMAAQLQGA